MPRFILGIAVALSFVACSSSGEPTYQVHDELGRTCSTNGMEATCDAVPQPSGGCTSPREPCFVIGAALLDPRDISSTVDAVCAACCDVAAHTSDSIAADCAAIVCTTPADCPTPVSQCVSGYCK